MCGKGVKRTTVYENNFLSNLSSKLFSSKSAHRGRGDARFSPTLDEFKNYPPEEKNAFQIQNYF